MTGLGCINIDLESQIYEHDLGEDCGISAQIAIVALPPKKPGHSNTPLEQEQAEQDQPVQEQPEADHQAPPVVQRVSSQD